MTCEACGFTFYNPRPDDAEMVKHYRGYRSPEYLDLRNSFEPWYTASMNSELGSKQMYVERRKILAEILRPHLAGRHIRKVLDYGGDHGDLVAGLIPYAQAYLYDISGAEPVDGVESIANPADLMPGLIINSNVLEHVNFPQNFARDILRIAPEGSLVFLEVPFEIPLGAYRLTRRVMQIALTCLLRPAKARALLTPKALYLMHEHINYFSKRSLASLMLHAGGSILASGAYPSASAGQQAEMGWVLGMVPSKSTKGGEKAR